MSEMSMGWIVPRSNVDGMECTNVKRLWGKMYCAYWSWCHMSVKFNVNGWKSGGD